MTVWTFFLKDDYESVRIFIDSKVLTSIANLWYLSHSQILGMNKTPNDPLKNGKIAKKSLLPWQINQPKNSKSAQFIWVFEVQ